MNNRIFSQDNTADPDKSHDTATIEKEEVEEPKMYQVLMLNDDYTTMEFVIYVLKRFFNKEQHEAEGLMLKIHHDGMAVCGIYTCEVAESKALKVNRFSRGKGHPLKCSTEPCD